MSISGAFSNALSGLTAASRGVEVVSSNVANAATPGYGRQELELKVRAANGSGAGVQIVGLTRNVDQPLLNDRRIADAASGDAGARADFLTSLETAIGTPDDLSSLSGRVASFDSALIEAGSMPNSDPRLASVLDSAKALTGKINQLSDTVQAARQAADQAIAADVGTLNDTLTKVQKVNVQIRSDVAAGHDASGLMDQRQQLVDQISSIVPMREVSREFGQIALFTTGGAALLDGKAARLGFTPTATITADMTQTSGALSGLTLNGMALSTGSTGILAGGSMGAQFALRDQIAPEVQARLDGLARDLVSRFVDPSVDPTLTAGDSGLFTDAGAAFNPVNEVGLAGRIAVNVAVDPDQGGALSRLRDGLNATAAGPAGNATNLSAMELALTRSQVAASGGISASARSFSALAADFTSIVGTARQGAENEASFTSSKADSLKTLELQNGVDTDHEMQNLIALQQSYAANAKVVRAVDELVKTLLGM